MLSQAKSGSDVIFESSNVIQEDKSHGSLSACTIDEKKYSSLRRLLRVTALCSKFVKIRIWDKCTAGLKERVCKQHRIFRVLNDLNDTENIYFQDFVSATCSGFMLCNIESLLMYFVLLLLSKGMDCRNNLVWSQIAMGF